MANKASGGEQWASRIGVILAVAGSAVGLGNFLRFPGQAAQHGGGAFLIPYFVALVLLGIPLCWAEWTMGRYGGLHGFNSAPGIYSVLWRSRLARYCGAIALLVPLVIYMYYVLIEAWCLGYAVSYLTGDPKLLQISDSQAYADHFAQYVGSAKDGAMFEAGRARQLAILLTAFLLNFVLIYRGVSKGIERFCQIALPVMAVLAVLVLVRVLTLGTPDPAKPDQSVLGGLGFMWNPRFDQLASAQTWLAASGQIFFTLSVGFGIIVNYASYLRREDDVVLSGLTATSMNEFFEVCLGGMITLPAAYIFLGAAAGDQGTFGLGFVSLPNVFAQMSGGRFFGFLWFFMLFIAAITSSVSMLQPVIAFLEEGFGLKRHASVALLGLITALGCGFVVFFSQDMVALDTFDFWVGSVLILFLALIQSLLYGWVLGIEAGEQEAHAGAHLRIPRIVQYLLKYVVPVYLGVIFVAFCAEKLPSSEVEVGHVPAAVAASLVEGPAPAALLAALPPESAAALGASAVVVKEPARSWQIRGAAGELLYELRASADGGATAYRRVPGYVEQIAGRPSAVASVGFLATIMGFLLLLTHIAGKRWEQQGRLTYPRP
jgi:SNF family Na+-dependent transporter